MNSTPSTKILLAQLEGPLTEEAVADFSFTTEFALSGEFVRAIAEMEPAVPDAANRPRFLVASPTASLALMTAFEIVAQHNRPRLSLVHSRDEALKALGIQFPHFEPLA